MKNANIAAYCPRCKKDTEFVKEKIGIYMCVVCEQRVPGIYIWNKDMQKQERDKSNELVNKVM